MITPTRTTAIEILQRRSKPSSFFEYSHKIHSFHTKNSLKLIQKMNYLALIIFLFQTVILCPSCCVVQGYSNTRTIVNNRNKKLSPFIRRKDGNGHRPHLFRPRLSPPSTSSVFMSSVQNSEEEDSIKQRKEDKSVTTSSSSSSSQQLQSTVISTPEGTNQASFETPLSMPPSSDLYTEAERLRQKARQLMQEANIAERELQKSKLEMESQRHLFLDEIIQEFADMMNCTISSSTSTNVNVDVNVEINSSNQAGQGQEEDKSILLQRVVDKLQEKKLSAFKTIQLIERMHEREMKVKRKYMNGYNINPTNPTSFNIGDVSNSMELSQNDVLILQGWIDRIIEAQSIIDETTETKSTRSNNVKVSNRLKSRIKELRKEEEEEYQRNLAKSINKRLMDASTLSNVDSYSSSSGNEVLQNFAQQTFQSEVNQNMTSSNFNMTRMLEDIIQIPLWVPSSILPYVVLNKQELDPDDLKKIRSEVLMGSQFQCTSWDSMRLGAVYRGNLIDKRRASSISALVGVKPMPLLSGINNTKDGAKQSLSEVAFREIQERLEKAGLADKIQLFLMEDPEFRPGLDTYKTKPQPVILAVSTGVVPDQGINRGKFTQLLTILSISSTIFTTFAYAVSAYALNPNFFNAVVNENDISLLWVTLPIFFGVFALSIVHEVAHYIAAEKNGIKLGWPVPLPSLQIGTFGSITPLRSFPPSRSSIFDVAISGPLVTAFVSTLMTIIGLILTIRTPATAMSGLAVIPAALTKMSFLVGSITTVLAPKIMMMPLSQPIPVHPLFLIGFAGLVGSALNLLPIGKLDGGRASTAIFGRRTSYLISIQTLFLMAVCALTGISAISIFWGLLITLFQRNADVPIRDELTEVNDVRYKVYIFSIVLAVLTLVPFPGSMGAL